MQVEYTFNVVDGYGRTIEVRVKATVRAGDNGRLDVSRYEAVSQTVGGEPLGAQSEADDEALIELIDRQFNLEKSNIIREAQRQQ